MWMKEDEDEGENECESESSCETGIHSGGFGLPAMLIIPVG